MFDIHSQAKCILFPSFILLLCFHGVLCDNSIKTTTCKTQEIMATDVEGGNCTCPPPPPGPDQLIFADVRLAAVFPTIQNFKKIITSDPLNVTQTWVGSDICTYRGFYCDKPPDNASATALAAIDFNGFQLGAPTLEGFLDQLPDLAIFHANTNNFTGAISPKIASLRYLYEFDISNNRFSGVFPTAVLAINGLTFLDIRYNSFTGSVPGQVFMQTDLEFLFLNNNIFMERLPDNLGASSVLYLTLANNKFTGPLPRSIGRTSSNLTEVLFLNNLLSGCLPYAIGFLTQTTVFDVGTNQLTGPLPWSLGCLEKVEILNFAHNQLYGEVPDVLCALGNLANLSLSYNYFTHVGPLCWELIKRGVLDVRMNCIPHLPGQRSPIECFIFLFLEARLCPFHSLYSHIPCKHPHFSSPHQFLQPSTAPSLP